MGRGGGWWGAKVSKILTKNPNLQKQNSYFWRGMGGREAWGKVSECF